MTGFLTGYLKSHHAFKQEAPPFTRWSSSLLGIYLKVARKLLFFIFTTYTVKNINILRDIKLLKFWE
jgi:hypothetical protein